MSQKNIVSLPKIVAVSSKPSGVANPLGALPLTFTFPNRALLFGCSEPQANAWIAPTGQTTPLVLKRPTIVLLCPSNNVSYIVRKELKEHSALGEYGADAIKQEMERLGCRHPIARPTINRILQRNGIFDGKQRQRRTPPSTGWYLPDVANGFSELDQFDFIEDLSLEGGRLVHVFNGISIHGGLVASYPVSQMRAENTVQNLISFWQEFGFPDYAQFDNSTIFQGSQKPDSLGRVIRLCLGLDIVPVFAPPRETGFQASIESYNGRWQTGVWQRFHFANLRAVQRQSAKYVGAARAKNASRRDATPTRGEFPKGWQIDYLQPLQGKVIFIRRSNDQGQVNVMGHQWIVPGIGAHHLVRAEVNLTENEIDFYRLRRREPSEQEHLATAEYHFPKKIFRE